LNLSPIVLFVYNRLWHTQKTVEALQRNELAKNSDLYVYCDAEKSETDRNSVNQVRMYVRSIGGFKKITIIERESNWGLANSIIDGVTTVVNEYGKVIVLEDDLVSSSCFLKFMNDSLNLYEHEYSVASIHGYIYPIDGLPKTFFLKGADCWGWATWKRAWDIFEPDGMKLLSQLETEKSQKEADFNDSYAYTQMLKDQINGKNNSWAIRWYMSAFLKNMLTLYPGRSYVENIGNDGSGTHCASSDEFSTNSYEMRRYKLDKIEVSESKIGRLKTEEFFRSITKYRMITRIRAKFREFFL